MCGAGRAGHSVVSKLEEGYSLRSTDHPAQRVEPWGSGKHIAQPRRVISVCMRNYHQIQLREIDMKSLDIPLKQGHVIRPCRRESAFPETHSGPNSPVLFEACLFAERIMEDRDPVERSGQFWIGQQDDPDDETPFQKA
jgi:hypothetical protein